MEWKGLRPRSQFLSLVDCAQVNFQFAGEVKHRCTRKKKNECLNYLKRIISPIIFVELGVSLRLRSILELSVSNEIERLK